MEPVKVAVRIRPLTDQEQLEAGQGVCVTELRDGCSLHVDEPGAGKGGKVFGFHKVYGANDDNKKVFSESALDLVESCLQGINATVLAYGQTGSGKTYTMTGITPLVLETIFANCPSTCTVQISYLEVYNDTVRDLLNPENEDLPIREAQDGAIHVPNMTLVPVATKAQALHVLHSGTSYRATAPTLMNSSSSRSHSIFTIHMRRTEGGTVFMSKCHLVDLAGSERNKKTGNTGDRFKESVGINAGLLALSNVITGLAKRPMAVHIPFRDSKLTRLLQDALGGSSRTVFIACISPSVSNQDETISTLTYAARAKKITNTPVICKELLSQLRTEQEGAYFGFNRETHQRDQQRAKEEKEHEESSEVQTLRSKISDLQEELEADEGIFAEYLKETRILKKRLVDYEALHLQLSEELEKAYEKIAMLEEGCQPARTPVHVWGAKETADAATCTSLIPTRSLSPEKEDLAENKLQTLISVVELQGLRERESEFEKVAKDNYYYQKTNKKLKHKLRELTEGAGE
eukprot:TRINITY_DN5328_c2_g2_i1.p1 TRINITY_DN5328_c2_g2~~TRINITY_DN5328_c2_g2_i1.p1  ORF type:complete len:529 (+),score=211.44 TRINITY_DN5328_c2_g2_i1:33-1589(+)